MPKAKTIEMARQVAEMRREGLKYADIGERMGFTMQRAQQLKKLADETGLVVEQPEPDEAA